MQIDARQIIGELYLELVVAQRQINALEAENADLRAQQPAVDEKPKGEKIKAAATS